MGYECFSFCFLFIVIVAAAYTSVLIWCCCFAIFKERNSEDCAGVDAVDVGDDGSSGKLFEWEEAFKIVAIKKNRKSFF